MDAFEGVDISLTFSGRRSTRARVAGRTSKNDIKKRAPEMGAQPPGAGERARKGCKTPRLAVANELGLTHLTCVAPPFGRPDASSVFRAAPASAAASRQHSL